MADGRGIGTLRAQSGQDKRLFAGVRLGGRGGQDARRRLHGAPRFSLAALARARGIPARVAIGLVYMEGRQAFGYHMWTEVYIDGRWIPIDGTLAQGGIGAGHLTIAHTNLEGTSAYSTFLPVVQILGRLSIEVIDAK